MKDLLFNSTGFKASPYTLSIVVPVYNEEENITNVYLSLDRVLGETSWSWEIIFVDDGSNDGSWEKLRTLVASDHRVRAVRLRRNFGQTSALAAGFDQAQGEVIITLDGDLQNDPADIPRLLAKIDEGYDIVSGWRKKRKDPFFAKTLPSLLANKLTSLLSGVSLHDHGCTLKAYRREILDQIHLYSDFHRFIPVLGHAIGARLTEIEVRHHPRQNGNSKYGATRMVGGLLDLLSLRLLSSYTSRPMRIFGGLGFGSLAAFSLTGAATVAMKIILGTDLTGNPLLYLTMLFAIASMQFFGLGFLGELATRTYHESQRKPTYVIREVLTREREPLASI